MRSPQMIVFVCLHGTAKSVIAAAYWNRFAAERGVEIHATAVGIEPDPEIPPSVRDGLHEDGLDVGALRPRRVTPDELSTAAQVVSFGCDLHEVAPPGRRVEWWDDVPAVSEGFREARDAIVARVQRLLEACG
ncbi:MAG TPA: hypothetical protein VJT33_10160 [bacterium]|nr:hypothetical protein [bacterium]